MVYTQAKSPDITTSDEAVRYKRVMDWKTTRTLAIQTSCLWLGLFKFRHFRP